jgi:hypothetical protein
MKEYSFKITLIKGAKYFCIFLLPLLVDKFIISYPEIAQLTVGGILVMIANYAKFNFSKD